MVRWGWVLVGLMGCGGASVSGIDPPPAAVVAPEVDAAPESPDADIPDVLPSVDAAPDVVREAGPVLPAGCVRLDDCQCDGTQGCHDVAPQDAAPPPPVDSGPPTETVPSSGCEEFTVLNDRCADSGIGAPGPFYYSCAPGSPLPTAKCYVHTWFYGSDGGVYDEGVCCP